MFKIYLPVEISLSKNITFLLEKAKNKNSWEYIIPAQSAFEYNNSLCFKIFNYKIRT